MNPHQNDHGRENLRQLRLPLDRREATKHRAPWEVDGKSEAREMIAHERRHIEQVRADFIASICDQYREGGSDIQLIRPTGGLNRSLHLFVNGKCLGYFDDSKEGVVFHQVGGANGAS